LLPDWLPLGELITAISVRGFQVQTDRYGAAGNYPIVDQGKALICGYTNAPPLPCRLPVTVFGDHTREVKFVDFPFVVGADGTKVLEPSGNQDPRYLSALVQFAAGRISNLGYARHFKELKEAEVPYLPDPSDQQRIAAVLDAWNESIALARDVAYRYLIRYKAIVRRLAHREELDYLEDVASIESCDSRLGIKDVMSSGSPLFTAGGIAGLYEPAQRKGSAVILSAIGAQCGKCFYADDRWTAGANTIVIASESQQARFLYHYLETLRPWLIQGSGQPYISPANARRTPVPRLTALEVESMVSLFDEALASVQRANSRLDAFSRQKHGLMQKLLTGEWRVPATGAAFHGDPAADRLEAAE